MRVFRTRPKTGWTPVGNVAGGQNFYHSLKAKGLLLTLMSYPDGYDMTLEKIVRLHQLAGGKGEGKHAVRGAMQELREAGLVIHMKERAGGGKWSMTTAVSDDPQVLFDLLKG